jgi:hypothetical protein
MKLDAKMRRGGLLLREGERRDPPCMLYKCHFSCKGVHSRGVHHRERGHHRREEKVLRGWEPPFSMFKPLSKHQGGRPRCGALPNL